MTRRVINCLATSPKARQKYPQKPSRRHATGAAETCRAGRAIVRIDPMRVIPDDSDFGASEKSLPARYRGAAKRAFDSPTR
jgi:hypothetical protein